MSRASCRLCLSEAEFNVSLFGNFCRRNNMVDKIKTCLDIVIRKNETFDTICYKCAENIQSYYSFIKLVRESQILVNSREKMYKTKHQETMSVPKQFVDMDSSFSFLDIPNNHSKDKNTSSSPLFSFFSAPNTAKKTADHDWKTQQMRVPKPVNCDKRLAKGNKRKHCSRDLFDSQSQDLEEDPKSQDTKISTGNNLIKKVRQMCYMEMDY